ncbi:hypothetical protein RCL_jg7263.t1 [Rhizophagus clarus]|uniref:Uncharacterized protein n=1 Tax=Rhizophagus clarus TaxID=94130 RepID=A0A8H3QLF4_9GLOM|nr:hypothetical protein RCL_jg7263.t1 [Rhizophagus clarus]
MSDSSDNNDLFHDNVFCSSTNSEDIQFMNELLGKDTSSATSSPVKKKKKKSKKKSKKYTTKKTSQIASPPIMPDEISLRASCEYFYEDIITYIIMKNFQGITAISVEKQAERLVKTFGEAGHLLRFKAFSQNTDKHPLLQQRFSSNFEEIMEEAAHLVISREIEKIESSSTQS